MTKLNLRRLLTEHVSLAGGTVAPRHDRVRFHPSLRDGVSQMTEDPDESHKYR